MFDKMANEIDAVIVCTPDHTISAAIALCNWVSIFALRSLLLIMYGN